MGRRDVTMKVHYNDFRRWGSLGYQPRMCKNHLPMMYLLEKEIGEMEKYLFIFDELERWAPRAGTHL